MNSTLLILAVYFALLFIIAWYFSRKQNVEGYFANSRSTSVWLLTFSTVATVVGAGGTVGVVAEVFNSGISYGLALPASFVLGMIILGITAKKIKQVGDLYHAYTVVDFFEKRFGKSTGRLTALLQLLLLIVWIGAQAVAIASLASVMTKTEYNTALVFSAIITIAYTSLGGLKVDIITDFIQFWIIVIVFFYLAAAGLEQTGGMENLFSSLPQGHLDPFAFGGVGWFLGIVLLSGWLFLGNTSHWQRIFSASSPEVARKSFFAAIPFVIILSAVILFIGLEASVLLDKTTDKNTAVFAFMDRVLPVHWKAVGYAAILAVIMSSVDSYMVGGSAIIFNLLPQKGSRSVFRARLITMLFGAAGFLVAYLIPDIVKLSLLITYQALIFVPAILAGLYSRKVSSKAAFYSILIPSVVLWIMFWSMPKSVFLITTLLSVGIILLKK